MPTIVLDAAIELLGKYQSELQVSAIHLNLSANGDIEVSIIPCSDGNATKVDYGRIDTRTKRLRRTVGLTLDYAGRMRKK